MNSLRCVGLLMLVLMSGCDADKQPPPAPKVASEAVAPVPPATQTVAPVSVPEAKASVAAEVAKPQPVVHELAPNVSAVSVVAASKSTPVATKPSVDSAPPKVASAPPKSATGNAKSAKVKEDNSEIARRAPVASKSKTPAQVVKDTRLPKAALDLSLPPDMVKQLTPPSKVITAAPHAKPLLPKMFPDAQSDPDFQLNGRLLSNEMQLQLRNESRRDIEGAAVDFTFKQ
jgi:hypothetical protein